MKARVIIEIDDGADDKDMKIIGHHIGKITDKIDKPMHIIYDGGIGLRESAICPICNREMDEPIER